MTTYKAWVAGAVAFLAPILSYLGSWLSGSSDWAWRPFLAFLIASVLTGLTGYGFTWRAPYIPKARPEHSAAAVAADNAQSATMSEREANR